MQKVNAYLYRKNHLGEKELLVFRHRDYPDAGVQVPGGTVESNDSLEETLYREVYEEAGILLKGTLEHLGSVFGETSGGNRYERHFYSAFVKENRDSWVHRVSSGAEDRGLVFEYYWVNPVDVELEEGYGEFL